MCFPYSTQVSAAYRRVLMATFFTGPSDVPPEPSVLEATKRAAGFDETVVQVFGDRSII